MHAAIEGAVRDRAPATRCDTPVAMRATWRGVGHEVLRGLTEPSLTAIGTAAVTVLLVLFVGLPLLSVSTASHFLKTRPYDSYPVVAARLQRYRPSRDRPLVVLIGSSG